MDDDKILDRIEKLLRLARNNPNEHEAESALKMAQSIADAHNIDIASVKSSKAGQRSDKRMGGGLYPYQRTLFKNIAELNHCMYWHEKGLTKGAKYEHRLLGSKLNVMLAQQMAEYLQDTVEAITRTQFCGGDAKRYFTKDAHIFREGMVDRICVTIQRKRREDKAEQERRNAERKAHGENALVVIDDVARREEAANYDYLHGEGAWDALQARAAERQRQHEEAMARFEQWKIDNPEEWAKVEAERKAEQEKWAREWEKKQRRREARGTSAPRTKRTKYDNAAYWEGHSAGEKVRLDKQVDGAKVAGALK